MANDSTGQPGDLNIEFVPEGGADQGFIGSKAEDTQRRGARQVVREEAGKLSGQAGDKIRAFADDGKTRATGALDGIAKMIDEAAGTIDEKVGDQYGGYARQASSAVTGFADNLRDKDVDDLMKDAREFVRKSPGVAIGLAAVAGFALARLLRAGADANRKG